MQKTSTILSKQAQNGVISMKQLKQRDLRLMLLLQSHFDRLSKTLQRDHQVSVLQDLKPIQDTQSIKLFLQYHYGKIVNLTDLRINHRNVYRKLDQEGSPRSVLRDWGFIVAYSNSMTEEMLVSLLQDCVDAQGILQIDPDLYGRVGYRARCAGLGVPEYVRSLGFTLPAVDTDRVVYLKDVERLTYRQIENVTGIPRSTAQKIYRRVVRQEARNESKITARP